MICLSIIDMASYEADQERLRRLMEEVMDDEIEEVFDDESSESEDDAIEERVEDSDSEQDISDSERNAYPTDGPEFLGKDKISKWKKIVPKKSVRTRRENIVTILPSSKLATRSLKTPLETFKYFINDSMVDIIVENTNIYINSISNNFERSRDALPTNKTEIYAFLGLLIYAGVLKSNMLNVKDLWKSDGSGIEMFRLAMSIKRFLFLLRCLRFDNKQTREDRKALDKLAPIREFFDIFVEKCKTGYSPSAYMTVDEKLERFRGKCSFRQYIPSKPNRYGIKIFALCDAKMYYTTNLEVYTGQQPEGPYKVSNSPSDVVLRLCEVIKGSGRNVTLDNWFTSVPLVEKLAKDYKLTVIGTIRKNKKELPLEFSQPAHPPGSSMFAFGNYCTLVSYIPKKNRNVLLVSSLHHDDNVDSISGKPEIIVDYNNTKGGVDIVDRLCSNYNVARSTKRWPMVIFYAILNVAAINSLVVFSANNQNTHDMRRRQFLQVLSHELIVPHIQERSKNPRLPKSLRERMQEICGNRDAPGSSLQRENENRMTDGQTGRCAICSSKKSRKTRFHCRKCGKFMCLEHLVAICDECFPNQIPDTETDEDY